MNRRMILSRVTASLAITSLLLTAGGYAQVQAQEPPPDRSQSVQRIREKQDRKITHAEREAAAQRAAEKGFKVSTLGTASAAKPMAINAVAEMAPPGSAPHYYSIPNYANSPLPIVDPTTGAISGGIRKFVDGLPGLTEASANNLGQYIPIAIADTTTYPGSDYFEIAVVQYREQMHSDLPATLLRGYVQLETPVNASVSKHVPLVNENLDGTSTPILLNGNPVYAVDNPHYLGPTIAATKNKPTRILFRNLLPTGQGGDLFIPVDTTVMGSGMGPMMGGMMEMDPQHPMCGMTPKPMDCYTENRATLHLHGGITPWISDGTPHQWTTPADEMTPYPAGVSVKNVPDMPDPGPGAITFFYTNQQSARLLFYHDHAWGITRLNVYAGEAAPYLITDPTEQALVNQGILPADQIPLVVQDKTFVPPVEQLAMQDPTWDLSRWGGYGDLWVPHVYVPAQNPGDASGVNQFGRWAYGPWFWPPTSNIAYPPVPNPYYDPNCNPDDTWCEPPEIPGAPFVSMGMEAFNDTPLVNGTAYPTLNVEPKAYRMRILNAANDRFFNLHFWKAVDANGVLCDAANPNPAPESTGVACTEVALNPAEVEAALEDPAGVFPTPLAGGEGPSWVQIGTEGGFLPAPTTVAPQAITWVTDPTVFNAGNVDKHSLLLGPAERADVVVDFSAFAGQTLILYNDAPAAFPARDPRYDYYTGNPDLTETGGTPPTLPGYGPNTRTVMQIKVAAAPAAPAYDVPALQTAFAHKADGSGVFEQSQNPIIVGQSAYNSAYGTAFNTNGPNAGLVQIFNTTFSFKTLAGGAAGPSLTMPLQPKQIQDEMGEAFDQEYGRMSGFLGLEAPGATAGVQNMILYPFVNPATEIIDGIELPVGVLDVTPIAAADDGTQIWKITHNGVDTHPIHFHLYDVQLINRVGWDGIIRRPDANELGWKDTVRISPLEDTIVALRPIIPKSPFGLPDSIRPLNPMMPLGSTAMFNSTDPFGNPIVPPISNQIVNFGWEYVWHCHILSHEEMDMMRPVSVNVSRALATMPVLSGAKAGAQITLTWTDGTPITTDPATWGDPSAEIGYRIERATVAANGAVGPYATVGTALANVTRFVDTVDPTLSYSYRVIAFNAAGDSASAPMVVGAPNAPTNLAAALVSSTRIDLSWADNANNETGFRVERAPVVGGVTGAFAAIGAVGVDVRTYSDVTVAAGSTYAYRVIAVNASGDSAPSNVVTLSTAVTIPAAPTNLTAVANGPQQVTLNWQDNANNETGFIIRRAVGGGAFVEIARLNTANPTSYVDMTVSPNTTYRYRVLAFNAAGISGISNTPSVTTPGMAPATPSNLRVTTVAATSITIAWNDNSTNELGFYIERSTNGTTWNRIGSVSANVTTFTSTGLRVNRTYWYRVQAQNAAGVSQYSNIVNATTR